MKCASVLNAKNSPLIKTAATVFTIVATCLFLSACSAEIGSERWCKNMDGKPKGDWSANEVKDYAKHCVFK